jgi:2',3'-cyclic-nucleotide 2'-phosphodiesterase (5'-nucleotidase family)|tara:strand:- start:5654 stop:6754 length:1101 start_codon:yes stop_codon:yes gene_type:complete
VFSGTRIVSAGYEACASERKSPGTTKRMNKLVILSFKIIFMIFSLNPISKPFNFAMIPMYKHTPFTIIFFLFLVYPVFGNGFTIYVLHTNNTNGKLENCYCPDLPLGSLEKRAVFVQSFLKEHPNTIVVDAGDFFSPVHKPLKDSLVTEAYSFIPYDAILPGDQELTRGQESMDGILRRIGADLVVSNVQSPLIQGSMTLKIVERGGLKVGILGVLGNRSLKYYPKEISNAIILHDPVTAVKNILKKIREKVDVVLVLSHQGFDQDVSLARQLKEIDIIIGAHSQTVVHDPKEENGVLITQAGKDGHYVGVIKIQMEKQKKIVSKTGYLKEMTLGMIDHPKIMELIQEYEEKSGFVNRAKLKHKEK